MENLDLVLARAYEAMNRSRRASTEDITCDPDIRTPFLNLVRNEAPEVTEAKALRRLSYLRKRSRLPRLQRT